MQADVGSAVSVVIATRDRRKEPPHTVERLPALPERPHVIVVDNASRDGSAAAVLARLPGVKLIGLARNAGAAARNIGVRSARTPYVALEDPINGAQVIS